MRIPSGLLQNLRSCARHPPTGALRFPVSPLPAPREILPLVDAGCELGSGSPFQLGVPQPCLVRSTLIGGVSDEPHDARKRLSLDATLILMNDKLRELRKEKRDLVTRLNVLEVLFSTGSSGQVLVCHCMHILVCRLEHHYNLHFMALGDVEKQQWLKVVKKYIGRKKFPERNIGFKLAVSALYKTLIGELQLGDNEKKFVREKMAPGYRALIGDYCEELDDGEKKVVRELLAPEADEELMRVLREWYLWDDEWFRPDKAAWRFIPMKNPLSERSRLEKVLKVVGWYVQSNHDLVMYYQKTSRAALVQLGKRIQELGKSSEGVFPTT